MIGGYSSYFRISPAQALKEPWHIFLIYSAYAAEQKEHEQRQINNGK